jgi:hypothetical protein
MEEGKEGVEVEGAFEVVGVVEGFEIAEALVGEWAGERGLEGKRIACGVVYRVYSAFERGKEREKEKEI